MVRQPKICLVHPLAAGPPNSTILGNFVGMTLRAQILECSPRQEEDVPLDHVHHASVDQSVPR